MNRNFCSGSYWPRYPGAKVRLAAAAGISMVAFGSAGCSTQEPLQHTLEISDVSLSGMQSRLNDLAKEQAVSLVGSLRPGDTLSIYAFGKELTSACQPITANFSKQGNSEEQEALKAELQATVPAAYDRYVVCVRDKNSGGSDDAGSPIFGAIAEAIIRAQAVAPVTTIVLITDGCSYLENVPTCKRPAEEGQAKKLIDRMPSALKPNLSGISIIIIGLGQGTGMGSEQVSGLREVFSEYANATGATVQFR